MNKKQYQAQAKGMLPEQTNKFKCSYCKEGWMFLEKDRFVCNRCKNNISREEGIKIVSENIESIQREDKFGIKNRSYKKIKQAKTVEQLKQ